MSRSDNRLNAVRVLKVLRECTDCDHGLTYGEIATLAGAYESASDRLQRPEIEALLRRGNPSSMSEKTVSRIIADLRDFKLGIQPVEEPTKRIRKDEAHEVGTKWYLEGEFDQNELRFLADGVARSRMLDGAARRHLIEKLCGLASVYFKSRCNEVMYVDRDRGHLANALDRRCDPVNKQLFLNLELLDEAIERASMVEFSPGAFDVHGALHPDADEHGEEKRIEFVPLMIELQDDRYYAVGCVPAWDEPEKPYHYRIDRLLNLKMQGSRPALYDNMFNELKKNSEKYLREHAEMFGGEPVNVRMRLLGDEWERALHHVFDTFGSGAKVRKLLDGGVEVRVRAPELAMRFWALRFSDSVEILEPESLRDTLAESGRKIMERYGASHGEKGE